MPDGSGSHPAPEPAPRWGRLGVRYLAIDLGLKRTGLAVGDDATQVASPLGLITTSNSAQRLQQIGAAIASHGAEALIVGLPLNMDGSEGDAARRTRQFARTLEVAFGLAVHLVDERLTSDAAQSQLNQMHLTRRRRKARRDALAAALILRDFFAAGSGGG